MVCGGKVKSTGCDCWVLGVHLPSPDILDPWHSDFFFVLFQSQRQTQPPQMLWILWIFNLSLTQLIRLFPVGLGLKSRTLNFMFKISRLCNSEIVKLNFCKYILSFCPSYLPWFEVFYKLLNIVADYTIKGQVSYGQVCYLVMGFLCYTRKLHLSQELLGTFLLFVSSRITFSVTKKAWEYSAFNHNVKKKITLALGSTQIGHIGG